MFNLSVTFTALVVALVSNIGGAIASPATAVGNSAPFGINFGKTWNNNVAWVDGRSKCDSVVVAPLNTNPCGREFNINGQSGFTLEGCGGPTLWVNKDHSFYANCGTLKEKDQCGVKSEFHCL